jgi:hypothetical protein
LEDVEELLESVGVNDEAVENDGDEGNPDESNGLENTTTFHGFEVLYQRVLDFEEQLLCSEVQAAAGDSLENHSNHSRANYRCSLSKPNVRNIKIYAS